MKVAIIDDSTFMRRLIRAALLESHPQAQIGEYGDAAEALLDMLMPRMNGLAFLTQLHASHLQPQVIAITADVQKTVRKKCLALGVGDFIEKPITFEKLRLALEKLVAA